MSETRFHKYFLKNPKKVTGQTSEILFSEFPLYRAEAILSQEYNQLDNSAYNKGRIVGRIDVIFRIKQKHYMAEIKNMKGSMSDFWYASKILAYRKYYEFQEGRLRAPHPAVIIPREKVTIENRIVAGSLGIEIFGYYKEDGEYKMEIVKF